MLVYWLGFCLWLISDKRYFSEGNMCSVTLQWQDLAMSPFRVSAANSAPFGLVIYSLKGRELMFCVCE